jgi:hypothetical protein
MLDIQSAFQMITLDQEFDPFDYDAGLSGLLQDQVQISS